MGELEVHGGEGGDSVVSCKGGGQLLSQSGTTGK